MSIAHNLERIQLQVVDACRRASRSGGDVRLMAVSKAHPAGAVAEAYAAGLRLFGENRVQEFQQKSLQLGPLWHASLPGAQFNLIGPLQSNKSARAVELFDSIDTVDSLKLAQRLDSAAGNLGKTLPILLEIKLSDEPSKHGLLPGSTELAALLEALPGLTRLHPRGLMTVPPFSEDTEAARPYFRELRELRDRLATQHPRLDFAELSMGMSHDFTVAIEEGSTCIRIGTALFGARSFAK